MNVFVCRGGDSRLRPMRMALEYSLHSTGELQKKGQGWKEGPGRGDPESKKRRETGQMWLQSERQKCTMEKEYKLLPIQLKLVVYVSLFRFEDSPAFLFFCFMSVHTKKKSDF